MPHKQELEFIPLHPTFAAEVKGVDFSKPISDDVFAEIKAGIAKARPSTHSHHLPPTHNLSVFLSACANLTSQYGVLVFRSTALTDDTHVAFASRFGPLDDVTPYTKAGSLLRLASPYLFDVSNLEPDNSVSPLTSFRSAMNRGNALFHVDSSFNPRRAGLSILRAAGALPPKGMGGATEFADTRAAWDELPGDVKDLLRERDFVAAHSLMHSRKLAAPEQLAHLDPEEHPMGRHRLAQIHEPSGRWNLYVAAHLYRLEGAEKEESDRLIKMLYEHACQRRFVVSVDWENEGDLVMWDNTSVMHRATEGDYEGKYARDMRRATVHDTSSQAWGLNDPSAPQNGFDWQGGKK